jgi:PEP-CTERM motif
MGLKVASAAIIVSSALMTCSGAALAGPSPVTATLSATYFEVLGSSPDPDFNIFNTPNVADGSSLGPDGFPVVSLPSGINDVGPGNQITWWSPTLNSNVKATGTGTITLPYGSNMFAPNSTGTDDGTFFETAFFKGNFTLSAPEAVEFQLGSDDDSFIYVDGTLIGQNPGVHGVTNVDFTSAVLPAGQNSIEVFYADRHQTGAFLSLALETSGVVITPGVPEPSTWAMLLVGFAGLGLAGYRQSRKAKTA